MRAAVGERAGNRLLEVVAVVLLGVATVGSAWCGYQATRWNGEENDLSRQSAALQVEAARQFGVATQTVSYDSNMLSQYANATAAGDEALMRFYRETLLRPEILPVVERWEADIAAGGTPHNLLDDEAYLDDQLEPYRATTATATDLADQAAEAGDHADEYVLTTLVLASALFFAGLTTSFRVRLARLLLLVGSSLLVAYAASRLTQLGVASR